MLSPSSTSGFLLMGIGAGFTSAVGADASLRVMRVTESTEAVAGWQAGSCVCVPGVGASVGAGVIVGVEACAAVGACSAPAELIVTVRPHTKANEIAAPMDFMLAYPLPAKSGRGTAATHTIFVRPLYSGSVSIVQRSVESPFSGC